MKTLTYRFESGAFLAIVWLLMFCSSCKKFVQIPPPKDELVTSTVFNDSVSATGAILGMYVGIMRSGGGYDGSFSGYCGLSGDELVYNGFNSNYLIFYKNALSSTDGVSSNFWYLGYKFIYQANACIEGLSNSHGLTSSLKNQLTGEAKLFRAFLYFYLVNLYGPVPLVTSTNYHVNAGLARASADSIYNQIVLDLTEAEILLTPNNQVYGNIRANAFAALALLSRVYLYQGNWNAAFTSSSQVIQSGNYQLETNLNNVFLPSSMEAIWQMVPVFPLRETPEGVDYIPFSSSSIPHYSISSYLLNAFDPGDSRRTQWIDSVTLNGVLYRYPFKYKLGFDFNTSPLEYTTVLRLGEQYLIKAEVEANGAGGGITAALSDLNTIRNRAGLANYAGPTDQASVLNAIYHERQVELCFEWGHRWFDLKRTGMVDSVMGTNGVCAAKGGTWSSDWQLYPVALSEIQQNSNLIQNPGY